MTYDIDALTGTELSAAVAREVMGWEVRNPGDCYDGSYYSGSEYVGFVLAFKPHADRNDSYRVLMRFGEIGGDWAELMRLIQGSEQGRRHFGMRLGLIIDPSIICRAALRGVREAKT
jgi:hypothetical protein